SGSAAAEWPDVHAPTVSVGPGPRCSTPRRCPRRGTVALRSGSPSSAPRHAPRRRSAVVGRRRSSPPTEAGVGEPLLGRRLPQLQALEVLDEQVGALARAEVVGRGKALG